MRIIIFLFVACYGLGALGADVSSFERLAVQDGGRIKPFDTFARESVQLLTGSQEYNGKNPTELVLTWLVFPNEWSTQKFIQIKNLQIKIDLGVSPTENFVSPKDLVANSKMTSAIQTVILLQKQKKKLDPYQQGILRIYNQLAIYEKIASGRAFKMIPQKDSPDWVAIPEFNDKYLKSFKEMATSFIVALARHNDESFKNATDTFGELARQASPQVYPSEGRLNSEILYNKIHPFRIAYILYLISAIIFAFSLFFVSEVWRRAGLGFAFFGVIVHVTGFIFRCVIAGRPPVSNMYESIIWVALGCISFGLIFELIYKRRFIGLAATAVATLALIIGDSVPVVLDQSIHPLEPVLRSNYWLTIHVLTITLSYAAFALAMGIGNIALSYYVRGIESNNREKLSMLALFIYRAIQVGVLLLTAGTILGGVWADYSWGRFWGWDPKETWALIADLGYLAVLHGRFSGWLRVFGTIAASVVAFTGVIMAWYGVNFVLGVGLHSYGFGGGGVHYVTAIVIVQLLYVTLAVYRRRQAGVA